MYIICRSRYNDHFYHKYDPVVSGRAPTEPAGLGERPYSWPGPWSDKIEDATQYNSKDDAEFVYVLLTSDRTNSLRNTVYVESYDHALALSHEKRLGANAIPVPGRQPQVTGEPNPDCSDCHGRGGWEDPLIGVYVSCNCKDKARASQWTNTSRSGAN